MYVSHPPGMRVYFDYFFCSPFWRVSLGRGRCGHSWCCAHLHRVIVYPIPDSLFEFDVSSTHHIYCGVCEVLYYLIYARNAHFTVYSLIAVIGFLDSIVAAKQNGARYRHPISPNRELVALGVSNLVGSFIPGTLPAYGSLTR